MVLKERLEKIDSTFLAFTIGYALVLILPIYDRALVKGQLFGAPSNKLVSHVFEAHPSGQPSGRGPLGPGDPSPTGLRPIVSVRRGWTGSCLACQGRSAPQSPEVPGQGTGSLCRLRAIGAGWPVALYFGTSIALTKALLT